MAADASIVFNTKVNNAGFNTGLRATNNALSAVKGSLLKLGGAVGAAFSVRAVVDFVKESRAAYREVAQNEMKLATVLRQRMGSSDAAIQNMLDFFEAEQKLGVVEADAMTAGAQELATYTDNAEALKTAVQTLNNISVQQYGVDVTAEQMQQTATMLGKVLDGQLGGLSRWGYSWTEAEEKILKNGTAMEKAATIAQVVKNSVGDMNYALAQTDIGRQKQLANTMGDVQEQFGAAVNQIQILFLPVLRSLAEWFGKVAAYARAAAQTMADMFGVKQPAAQQAETMEAVAASTGDAAGATAKLGDSVEESAKKVQKSLAPFDTLIKLTSQAADNAADAADGLDTIGTVGTGTNFGIQAEVDTSGVEVWLDKLKPWLEPIAGLLSAAKDSLLALWDAFAPFREWVGDRILDFLGLLNLSLTAFADWARENPEVIRMIATVIIGFLAGLWAYNSVMNIISFISTLVKAFINLGTGLSIAGASAMLAKISFGLLVGGLLYFLTSWDKLSNLSRVLVPIAAAVAAIMTLVVAIAALHTTWSVGFAAAGIAAGIALIAGTFISLKSIPAPEVTPPKFDVPYLATGAVIPANKQFLAVLGDQKHGRNLEGPESMFRQIVREESGSGTDNDETNTLLQAILDALSIKQDVVLDTGALVGHITREQRANDRRFGR